MSTSTAQGGRTAFRHPARPAEVAQVRQEVRAALLDTLGPDALGQVVLLVSELATNAVRHAGSPWFAVELERRRGVLHVEVRDGGRGLDGVPGERDPERAGGWGLFLVEQVAEDWGVEVAGGTRVWFDLRL